MLTISPDQLVMDALRARLSNISTGFNANLATVISAYAARSAPIEIRPWTVDFSSTSLNYYEMRTDWGSITGAGFDKPQMMLVWAGDSNPWPDGQRLIYHTFSGAIPAGIDVILQYIDSGPRRDFEPQGAAIVQAMRMTIDTPSNQSDFHQNGLAYDGHMQSARPPVVWGGENWQQAVRFLLQFNVNLL